MPARPADDQLVAGRYAWRERLGRGGFGVVWRAHDTLLQRDVAVKTIELPSVLDDEEQARVRSKVLREARAAARLNHPGLVTVFDVVEEDGRPLIVMELVKAPTLAQLVARDGPLSDERAAAIGLAVLDALEAAHAEGIIHRDVKPANVMVSDSGHVQLADFGIASIIDDPKVTSSGSVAGSPAYMAPEQAANLPTSAATDLWGLGTTLWFAVQGEPPFAEKGAIATMTAVVHEEPRPMKRDTALAPLLRDLLVKDPADRPSMAQVRLRLLAVSAGEPDRDGDDTATLEFVPSTAWTEGLPSEATVPEPGAPEPQAPEPQAKPEPSEPQAEPEPPPVTPPRPPVTPRPVVAPPPKPERPAPAPEPRAAAGPTGRRSWTGVAVLVVLALLAVVTVAILAGRGDDESPSTSPTTAAPSSPEEAAAVPDDWVGYRDPSTGFSISRPPDWTVQRRGTLTDFRDPDTGAYLRVDHRTPPGPSPEGAWYEFEPRFAAENANYRRIQITPTTYNGYPAAIWEFTYTGRGAELHAVDLGFIAGDYGFALNFQTSAADWERLQPVFEAFKASFKAPGA
jgi:eukaryotic-like serine/threonine-protein kinase